MALNKLLKNTGYNIMRILFLACITALLVGCAPRYNSQNYGQWMPNSRPYTPTEGKYP